MIKQRDCPECTRLWRDYQTTTTNHIHLCGKHRIAELQRDKKRAAEVQDMVKEAEQERDAAREAIRQHEAHAHGVKTQSDACSAAG